MRFRGSLWVSTQEDYLWVRSSFLELGLTSSYCCCSVGLKQCDSDHSVFVWRSSACIIVLAIYLGDILIFGKDSLVIITAWSITWVHIFHIKTLGTLRYFLAIGGCSLSKGPLFVSKEVSYWFDQIRYVGVQTDWYSNGSRCSGWSKHGWFSWWSRSPLQTNQEAYLRECHQSRYYICWQYTESVNVDSLIAPLECCMSCVVASEGRPGKCRPSHLSVAEYSNVN